MAQIIWTEPARMSLDLIADHIALENPQAARLLVQKVSTSVKQLARFPNSGSRLRAAPENEARQLVVKPVRIIYRIRRDTVTILHVMQNERLFRPYFLD